MSSSSDTVTVICIAYNHAKWVAAALESVKNQDYPNVQLIIVDNGSEDGSAQTIRSWVDGQAPHLNSRTMFRKASLPYCQLFNQVLQSVSSDYVIDLSGDDELYSGHISKSIQQLRQHPTAGFCFSDAYLVTEHGEKQNFYRRTPTGELLTPVKDGDLYKLLIKRSYICSPTILFRTALLKGEGGYDPDLTYEDFDVQLRLARKYPVVFSNHIGVMKRKHSASLSASQYKRYNSVMLPSTLKVCGKIKQMNQTEQEMQALRERVRYELKHALFSANFFPAEGFISLGKEIGINCRLFALYRLWGKSRLDLSWLYHKLVLTHHDFHK